MSFQLGFGAKRFFEIPILPLVFQTNGKQSGTAEKIKPFNKYLLIVKNKIAAPLTKPCRVHTERVGDGCVGSHFWRAELFEVPTFGLPDLTMERLGNVPTLIFLVISLLSASKLFQSFFTLISSLTNITFMFPFLLSFPSKM